MPPLVRGSFPLGPALRGQLRCMWSAAGLSCPTRMRGCLRRTPGVNGQSTARAIGRRRGQHPGRVAHTPPSMQPALSAPQADHALSRAPRAHAGGGGERRWDVQRAGAQAAAQIRASLVTGALLPPPRGGRVHAQGRGLHSFTSQLNLSALYGMGGARRGYVARVKGVLGGVADV